MKNWFRMLVPGLLVISLLNGESAWAQAKIGTVDLRKVFDNYWKKKQAEAALKERETDMRKEDDNMLADHKKLKDEYDSMSASINEAAISPEERDRRKKSAEDKLKAMKDLEDTIRTYERQADATLGEQKNRMRANIITEIRNVVNAKAKAAGFSLVVDSAADSANLTPVILFTNNENDITDAVLLTLNATAPTDLSKPDDSLLDKKDEKKKDGKK
jgi:outer membrane protein